MMTFKNILNLYKKESVCSFVGGGGKSTMIYRMANEFSSAGFNILVTTTTKIYHPEVKQRPFNRLLTGPPESIFNGLEKENLRGITVAAKGETYTEEHVKLNGFTPDEITKIKGQHLFNLILVEADGSRHLPIKAPGNKEPVMPESADIVFGVVGLDSIGKINSDKNVFRPKEFYLVSGTKEGEVITEKSIAGLVQSDSGLFKNSPAGSLKIVVLNKADSGKLLETGFETAYMIFTTANPPDKVIITSGIEQYKSAPVRGVIDKEKIWKFLKKQQA